jgi:hypothetical protein
MDTRACPTCGGIGRGYRCRYCENLDLDPMDATDETGMPVHSACGPGGAFRLRMEAAWEGVPMLQWPA